MIYSISIKNIALISEAEINFSDGFNVITGETGAGKSVLIGSISMLLGERMSKDIISNGCAEAEVSAVFYVEDEFVRKQLLNEGIELDDSGELVMTRVLHTDGKNICRINGRIVNVSTLKIIGNFLVDLHGQHNNQMLMDSNAHIDILDKFADKKILSVSEEYRVCYDKVQMLKKELRDLEVASSEKERKIDILNYEINEIKTVNPQIGEDEELKKKKEIADNFKKLYSQVGKAYYLLYENSDGISAYQSLADASMALSDASGIDDSLKDVSESVEEMVIMISEAAGKLSSYLDNLENSIEIDFDIDARLDELYKIKRKYGATLEEVLDYLARSEHELEMISNSEERFAELQIEIDKYTKLAYEKAEKLTEIRKKTAKKIEKEICDNLDFLNMNGAEFVVKIDKSDMKKNGCDDVEFLLTTIKGAPPKPLTKIASGGELSRIMLAIKTVLAETDSIKTMIFDEIDTGVSGIAAQKIGEKIKELSKEKQVFCVTHLAQIASKADTHFVIVKKNTKNTTNASVHLLDNDGRINEVARIISGDKITETTINQAKEMLNL